MFLSTLWFILVCLFFPFANANDLKLVSENVDASKEEFVGTLVYPESCVIGCPGLVVWSGSGGGAPVDLATYFAKQGYATLAIEYFTLKPQDEKPYLPYLNRKVALEVFVRAIDWLKNKSFVKGPISILGGSRGGEAALLVGAYFPTKVGGVVAHRTSSHAWSSRVTGMGLPASKIEDEVSSWTFNKKEVPYVSFEAQRNAFAFCSKESSLSLKVTSHSLADAAGGCQRRSSEKFPGLEIIVLAFSNAFNFLLDHTSYQNLEASRIKVEKILAPVFASGGTDDQMWPSERMQATIRAHRSNPKDMYLLIPGGGHLNNIPGTPAISESSPRDESYLRTVDHSGKTLDDGRRTVFLFGGNKETNSNGDAIIMNATLKFLSSLR